MEVRFLIDNARTDKRIMNRGEDAPPVCEDGIMIICDGTGATGQAEHEIHGEIYTSAYLGSRETSRIARDFLSKKYTEIMASFSKLEELKLIVKDLGEAIREDLREYVVKNRLELTTVRGKSFKLLPTTFTAVVYKVYDDYVDAIVLCAGDSRALWWDTDGLHQLSIDDNGVGGDISVGDCKISNCVSANSDFHINILCHKLPAKGILIATSDGFTDPIRPFQQEEYLIYWIGNCDAIMELTENNISEKLSEEMSDAIVKIGFTGRDDCSMSGVIIGYQLSEELKEDFRKRFPDLQNKYTNPYKDLVRQAKKIEEEQYNLKEEIYENEKKLISAIKDTIIKYSQEQKYFEDAKQIGNQFIFSAMEEISQEIIEAASYINKKKEDTKRRIENEEMILKKMYLDFLKKLCREPGNKRRFPDNITCAMRSELRFQESRKEYNNNLPIIKGLEEIKDDDSFGSGFWMNINEIQDCLKRMYDYIGTMRKEIGQRQANQKNIRDYFCFKNPDVERFYKEDFTNGFSILYRDSGIFSSRRGSERTLKSELLTSAEKMLKLYNEIEELRESINDSVVKKRKISAWQKLVRDRIDEIAEKLFRNEKYKDFMCILPQNIACGFDKSTEVIRSLQRQSDDIKKRREDIWDKYSGEYKLYLNNSTGIQVQVSNSSEY